MARARSKVKINRSAIDKILILPQAQAVLARKAREINNEARQWFVLLSRGESQPPIFYVSSFKVRRVFNGRRFVWQAYNDDPTALWVEFGAHAGGKTPILRYRPYGKALESLRVNS